MAKTKSLFIGTSIIISASILLVIYFGLVSLGVIQTRENRLTIETESITEVYNGEDQYSHEFKIVSGKLHKNHKIEPIFTGKQKNVGESDNTATIVILDEDDKDVTSQYDVTLILGKITITERILIIETISDEKFFDNIPLTKEEGNIVSGNLVVGHKLTLNIYGKITNVGTVKNEATATIFDRVNNDVTKNYKIEYRFGELEIKTNRLVIETGTNMKPYDGLPLIDDSFEIIEGSILETERIEVKRSSSLIIPGQISNKIYINIFDSLGNDITNNYEIVYVEGDLTVLPIYLTIITGTDTKPYDGMPLMYDDYEISTEYKILDNHEMVVDVNGTITDVGNVENHASAYVLDENGNDVSYYYIIEYEYGKLTVLANLYSSGNISKQMDTPEEKAELEVYSTKTGLVYLRDQSYGKYNMHGFDRPIVYDQKDGINPLNFTGMALFENEHSKEDIEIKFLRDNIPYLTPYYTSDNSNNSNDTHSFGPYQKNYSLNYYSYNFLKNSSVPYLKSEQLIKEEIIYRDFVYNNYLEIPESTKSELIRIARENGFNENSANMIKEVQNFVQNSGTYNMDFGPIPEDVDDIVIYFLDILKEGICQHFAAAGVLMYRAMDIPARYVTGYGASAKANKWVSVTNLEAHAWVEIYIDGFGWVPIEVTPGGPNGKEIIDELTLKPKDRVKMYDGLPLNPNGLEGFEEYEAMGYKIDVTYSGTITNPGKEKSEITSHIIYDPEGYDVTENFVITYEEGILEVNKIELFIKIIDVSKIYDNTELKSDAFEITDGELLIGHEINITTNGYQVDVGESLNGLSSILIYDKEFNDVSIFYEILIETGIIEILPRPITVQTGSEKESYYDGIILTNNFFEITKGDVINKHVLNITVTGMNDKVGIEHNTFDFTIIDEYGIDVSKNYVVYNDHGELEIVAVKKEIEIKSGSASKYYDGLELINHDFEVIGDPFNDHKINVVVLGTITEVGEEYNVFEYTIKDEAGNDVSDQYIVKETYGKLQVFSLIEENGENEIEDIPIADKGNIEEYENERDLFRVKSSVTETLYLRDKSYGDYNKKNFNTPNIYTVKEGEASPLMLPGLILEAMGMKTSKLDFEALGSGLSYYLPYYSQNGFYNSLNDINVSHKYSKDYQVDYYSHTVSNNRDYYGYLNNDNQAIQGKYRDYVYETYLSLPSSTRKSLLEIASINGLNINSLNIINEVQNYILKAATYKLDHRTYPENSDFVIAFLTEIFEGICQHFAAAATLMYRAMGIPARYVTGFVTTSKKDDWVTVSSKNAHAWVEIYKEGFGWIPIEVTPGDPFGGDGFFEEEEEIDPEDIQKIMLKPKDINKIYDGLPLTAKVLEGFEKYEDLGYQIEVTYSGSITNPGKEISSIIDHRIYDPEGKDVTDSFEVLYKSGSLQVYQSELIIYTDDLVQEYNGKYLLNENDNNYSYYGSLGYGHYISNVTFTGKQLDVGTSSNSLGIIILDEDGKDVTDTYFIIPQFGELKVTTKTIKITTGSSSKNFDGVELTNHTYELVGDVNSGELIEIIFSGSQTMRGSSDNTIESIEIIRNGKDITSNYKIEIVLGTLTVLR